MFEEINHNMEPARFNACVNQCRLAQYIKGRPNCIVRTEDSPGCPCESFGDCRLGLHLDTRTNPLWNYYDSHDYFPDWENFYLDLVNE